MFRAMRRKKQQLSPGACAEILRRGTSGVLAVAGDGGYPYAVPLSYVYDGQTVYFHSAKTGHKIDAVAREPRASFCVIDRDEVLPEAFTTAYRSVIVFGRVRVVCRQYVRGWLGHYIRVQLIHAATLALNLFGTAWVCSLLPGGWAGLIARAAVVLVVPNAVNLLCYAWTADAAYLRSVAGGVWAKLTRH